MMLTTKGRYAVMAITSLAKLSKGNSIALSVLANDQNIALNYLEQIFSKLRSAGIVISSKGPGGGYKLAKNIDKLNVYEIIDAVEENIEIVRCGHKSKGCMPNSAKCSTHHLWAGLEDLIGDYLKSKTLSDIVG